MDVKKALTMVVGLLFILFVFIVFLNLSGIICITCTAPDGPGQAIGFSRIKPDLAATGLTSSGHFTGRFTNGVGSRITFQPAEVVFTSSNGIVCRGIVNQTYVSVGDNFVIDAEGCEHGKPGDTLVLQITIPYTVTINGQIMTKNETGTLRSTYE